MKRLTHDPVDEDEEEREEDEARVPNPDCCVDGGDAEEHEYHRLGSVCEHLHGIFDCLDRVLVQVGVHVPLTADPTESNPVQHKHIQISPIMVQSFSDDIIF